MLHLCCVYWYRMLVKVISFLFLIFWFHVLRTFNCKITTIASVMLTWENITVMALVAYLCTFWRTKMGTITNKKWRTVSIMALLLLGSSRPTGHAWHRCVNVLCLLLWSWGPQRWINARSWSDSWNKLITSVSAGIAPCHQSFSLLCSKCPKDLPKMLSPSHSKYVTWLQNLTTHSNFISGSPWSLFRTLPSPSAYLQLPYIKVPRWRGESCCWTSNVSMNFLLLVFCFSTIFIINAVKFRLSSISTFMDCNEPSAY